MTDRYLPLGRNPMLEGDGDEFRKTILKKENTYLCYQHGSRVAYAKV